MKSLSDALEDVKTGDHAGALDRLLASWRATPTPSIAALVDRLSDAMTAVLPPLAGDGDAVHLAWMELAGEGRSSDVGRLVAALLRAPVGSLDARVDQWIDRPADPRVTMAFAAMIAAPPTTASSRFPMWTAIGKYLAAAKDARVRKPIAAWVAAKPAGSSNFYPKQRARLEKLLEVLPDSARKLSKEDATILEAIDAQLRVTPPRAPAIAAAPSKARAKKDDGEGLLRAVYAAPDDDSARLVYADFLSERGDPRGEFIVLQCGGKATTKGMTATKLFKLHGKEWLDELVKVIDLRGVDDFERGFLARVRTKLRTAAHLKTATAVKGDPRWSTVRELHGSLGPLVDPVFRSLRKLEGIYAEDFAAMAELDFAPPITELGVVLFGSVNLEAALARVRRAAGKPFMRITRLWLTEGPRSEFPYAESRWLEEVPFTNELEEIFVARDRQGQPWFRVQAQEREDPSSPGLRVVEWLPLFAARPKLQRVRLHGEAIQAHIERKPGGALRVRVPIYDDFQRDLRDACVLRWLRSLPKDAPIDLHVESDADALVTQAKSVGFSDLGVEKLVRD